MSVQRIPGRRLVVAVAAALGAMALGACASTTSTSTAPTPSAAFPTPLATSIQTSQGTWATVAMGHLDDPNNTFWQLLFRPSGSAAWSNQVEATATATNGGLVLADGSGRQLVVGIRPSQKLDFTPLIATGDAGRSWTNGLIDAGLAANPTALAVSPAGGALAVVADNHRQSEVIADSGSLSSWRTLVTASDLASEPAGRSCAPSGLNAVAYLGTSILVGAGCSRPAASAVFVSQGSQWHPVGPQIPANATVEVLGFDPGSPGVVALLGDAGQAHAQLERVVDEQRHRVGDIRPSTGTRRRTSRLLWARGRNRSVRAALRPRRLQAALPGHRTGQQLDPVAAAATDHSHRLGGP